MTPVSTSTFPLDADTRLEQYSPLVHRLAHQMLAKAQGDADLEDLLHVGMVGLSEALSTFDRSQGVQFESFATQRIRDAMLEEVRDSDGLRGALVDAIKSLPEHEQYVMSMFYEHDMNLKEAAAVLEVPQSHVLDLHRESLARLRVNLRSY
ncbi:MAG: sigma factor [Burkholderiaceae bacterium]